MAIIRKSSKKTLENFIENTAEFKVKEQNVKPKKVQFTHTINIETLKELDERANEIGLTRAGLVNLFISMGLKKEF